MMWVPDAAFALPWELCRVGVLPYWSSICRRCQWTVLWEVWKGEGDSLIAQQPRIRPSKSFSSFTTTDKYTVQFGIVFGNLDCLLDWAYLGFNRLNNIDRTRRQDAQGNAF